MRQAFETNFTVMLQMKKTLDEYKKGCYNQSRKGNTPYFPCTVAVERDATRATSRISFRIK